MVGRVFLQCYWVVSQSRNIFFSISCKMMPCVEKKWEPFSVCGRVRFLSLAEMLPPQREYGPKCQCLSCFSETACVYCNWGFIRCLQLLTFLCETKLFISSFSNTEVQQWRRGSDGFLPHVLEVGHTATDGHWEISWAADWIMGLQSWGPSQ